MHVTSIDQHHFEAALLEDLVEGNPVDPGRFHRHGLHPALRQPLCQALQIGGEGAELAYRLGVAFGRNRHEMTVLSAIDAGRIGLDAFEQRD